MRLRRNRFYVRVVILLASLLGLGSGVLAQGTAQNMQRSNPPMTAPAEKPTLTVGNAGEAQYTTIQAAIDAAPPGAIIRISPGVYPATLTIRKPLILQGAGWEHTTLLGQPPTEQKLRELTEKTRQQWLEATTDEHRRAIQAGIRNDPVFAPAVVIQDAQGVQLRGLKIAAEPLRSDRYPTTGWRLLACSASQVSMESCALLGSPGDGLHVGNGSDVQIRKCLVAGLWGNGIIVFSSDGKKDNLRITDSEIRNCYHYGILIGRGRNAMIERCWISGAAWHGIRYDDASPTIKGNRIFGNARSGIYASGKTAATVSGNLFLRNEMDGFSAWFQNADTIVGNTFVDNKGSGLDVLGASKPTVERNIFAGHPAAIVCSSILNETSPAGMAVGDPVLRDNLFWNNQRTLQRRLSGLGAAPAEAAAIEPTEDTRSLKLDPRFANPQADNFSLAPDSPARRDRIGSLDPLASDSPFPLQPEEKAIIPDDPTREFSKWKSPANTTNRHP